MDITTPYKWPKINGPTWGEITPHTSGVEITLLTTDKLELGLPQLTATPSTAPIKRP